MAGYSFTSQVDDAPTRKSLIAVFDLARKVESKVAALQAQVDTLQTTAITTVNTTEIVMPVTSGGTGLGSYSAGDLLVAQNPSTLIGLADAPVGNVLISGGVGNLPSYGKVSLTQHVSGILPVGNGGTNISSYTTGDLLYASAAGVLSKLADVAVGQVLMSGGVGAAPAYQPRMALAFGSGSPTPQVALDVISVNVDTLSGTGNPRGFNLFGNVVPDAGSAFRIRVGSTDSATSNRLSIAAVITLDSGYNSPASGKSHALRVAVNAVTPGLNPFNDVGNFAIRAFANGSAAPMSVGVSGSAGNGYATTGIGVLGWADLANGATAQGIGVWGTSIDSTAVGNIRIGGLFDLQGGSGNAPAETTTAALIADNRAVTAPIFVARDNATEVFRVDDGGNVGIGTGTFGASMLGGIGVKNGTAPTGDVTDCFQCYSADQAAGNAAPHFRTENGSIITLYKTGTYTPTNVTTDRSYDANATTVDELADVLGTLIADLQLVGLIG